MLNLRKIVTLVFFMIALSNSTGIFGQTIPVKNTSQEVESTFDLQMKLRQLWGQQAILTRNVMLCIVDTLPGEVVAINLLVKNQDEIGEALIPYFGIENSEVITEFLYSNVNFSIEVFKAARVDSVIAKDAFKKWHENSGKFCLFLKRISLKIPSGELKLILSSNIGLTFDELSSYVNGDLDSEKLIFEKVRNKFQQVADKMSNGIFEEFPEMFLETRSRIVQN